MSCVLTVVLAVGALSGCASGGKSGLSDPPRPDENVSDNADGQGSGRSADDPDASEKEPHRLRVVTTIFPQYDFVREIAGDRVDLKMLLKPGEETHSYEPTPQDIIAIQKCDVFLYVGGENDAWVEDILESMPEDSDMRTLRLVDCVDTVEEEHVEGMKESPGHEHEHDHGEEDDDDYDHDEADEIGYDHDEADEAGYTHAGADDVGYIHDEADEAGYDHDEVDLHDHETEEHDHASEEEHWHADGDHDHDGTSGRTAHTVHEIDEHVWTSPVNAMAIVDDIARLLAEEDEENAQWYADRAKSYQKKLVELDAEFREITEHASSHLLIFGDRFPFRYFADEYGLDYYAAFPGCASDTEPSAATMAFLIRKAREVQMPVILKMELSNANIANAVAEAAGAEVKVFYSCHNMTAQQFRDGESYLSMMKANAQTLKEVLNECP